MNTEQLLELILALTVRTDRKLKELADAIALTDEIHADDMEELEGRMDALEGFDADEEYSRGYTAGMAMGKALAGLPQD